MRSTDTHVFFWSGPFSNWHRANPFSGAAALDDLLPRLAQLNVAHPGRNDPLTLALANHRYNCGEQWMMATKAWLFGDLVRLNSILAASGPRDQKALGRAVTPFVPEIWDSVCVDVVVAGSIPRFEANPGPRVQLLATDSRVLVEGSPHDRVWGVGLRWDDPEIEDPRNWRGRNLLGIALVRTRNTLRDRGHRSVVATVDPVAPPRRRFSR